jgi:hypothetical protein
MTSTDDLTKPTTFDSKIRTSATDRATREGRIAAVLRTYCTPILRYDGISAYEIARKVLVVIEESKADINAELLAACKLAVEPFLEDTAEARRRRDVCRKAIAKAEGLTSTATPDALRDIRDHSA